MKTFILKTIIALVFIVLLDVLFFCFTDLETCPESVWAALVGLNVGYFFPFLIPVCAPKEKGLSVLSAQLYLIGAFYYTFEAIVGITFLFWVQPTMFWPVIIQSILLAIYIVVLLSSVVANDKTREALQRQEAESMNIKLMAEHAEIARQRFVSNEDAYRKLTLLFNELKSSPIRNSGDVEPIDKEIQSMLIVLDNYAADNDVDKALKTADKIRQLIIKRNFKIKNIQHY